MRAYLDQQELTLERASQREAFIAAIDEAQRVGRMVIEAQRDGAVVPTDDLAELPDGPGEASELRFVTAEPTTLVRVTLGEVADAMGELGPAQRALGESLQAGETDGMGEKLVEIVDTWQAVQQAIDYSGDLLGPELAQTPVKVMGTETTVSAEAPALSAALDEVRRAMTEQDWAGLADVLLEDLPGLSERWSVLVGGLSDRLSGSGGGSGSSPS
ncbi:MAG: hypothetical protein AAF297_04290 [Planctomycetota bacterium]